MVAPQGNYGKDWTYFWEQLEGVVVPNVSGIMDACRINGLEVLFTVMESMTKDGRDRSLDYKISGFNIPKGSWDGQVVAHTNL